MADLTPLRLMTVHAHPDDEASKGAPTLARYAAQGVRTVLVCCTGGEAGDVNNPALLAPGGAFHGLGPEATRALLATTRVKELERSASVIGFSRVAMLGYRDSGMPGSPHNEHPACFHQAPHDEAVERLVRLIREERPQVLITYNEDQQGYPHPDHLKVHAISVTAFDRAGDPQWYPQAGKAWQPLKLYYSMWSAPYMQAVHGALLRLRGASPYSEAWLARAHPEVQITTRVHIGDYVGARSAALRAHATQVDPQSPFWFGLSDEELRATYPYEDWCLARCLLPVSTPAPDPGEPSDLGVPKALEDDLFAGLRAQAQHDLS